MILLVDDSPEDREATVRAFRKAGLANRILECESGDEALDYLHGRGSHAGAPRPSVVLLDLNMPGTDGREVLAEIKGDPELRDIPVIVLTTSRDERDVEACYRAGANSYVQKPVSLDGFVQAIQRLKQFWFEVVVLPRGDGDE